MKTSIIIACLNKLDYTVQCLESIQAYTPEDHEIIFIDNGSTDGTDAFIQTEMLSHPNYRLIRNKENLGTPIAYNQAIAIATGDYLLFLNNDTVVSREWLKGLIDCAGSASDIACVGPMTNSISGPQCEQGDTGGYDSLFKYQIFAENYRKAYRGAYLPLWRIVGFCLLVKRSIVDEVGGFDEKFSPGMFDDDDFCLRCCLAGYRNMICHDVFIHHHGSATWNDMDGRGILEKNQAKFLEKHRNANPTISAVMIVKDEEANIAKCLDNLQCLVSEIIIVDTGSTDRTKEIAATYPKVRLFDHAWNDDFSAARNFANSKATGDWLLSLDADEIITGLENIPFQPYHAYRIVTRNYTNNLLFSDCTENTGEYPDHEQGKRWFTSTKIRLWPNDPRIAFEYPVHEVVENSVYYLGIGVTEVPDCIVHHYGRLNDNYEYGRGDKYLHLLHKQLESGKNDLRSLEQLALQSQEMKRFDKALEFWERLIAIDPDYKGSALNIGHCCASLNRWDEARKWSEKAVEQAPDSRDAAMNLATCEAMCGDRDKATGICEELIAKHPLYVLPQSLLNAMKINQLEVVEG